MDGREKKTSESDPNADQNDAREAASEVLSPGMPAAGAALVIDADPRLNRSSETEDELERLVKSNEDSENDGKKD